jgi:hypothetical protein
MTFEPSALVPFGETLETALVPPQTSVLPEGVLAVVAPQAHTTILDASVFQTQPNQVPRPTFLAESTLPSLSSSPKVSILPEHLLPDDPSPQIGTSILRPGLLESLPTPKMPNLVRPMPHH